jgi:uncharacterized protein YndB with AHSA1/START domain
VLDTIVTWTLEPAGTGTHLRMVHSGFETPQADKAYNAMSHGWEQIVTQRIRQVASSL